MGRTYHTDWQGWVSEYEGFSTADLEECARGLSGQLCDNGLHGEFINDPHERAALIRRELDAKRTAIYQILDGRQRLRDYRANVDRWIGVYRSHSSESLRALYRELVDRLGPGGALSAGTGPKRIEALAKRRAINTVLGERNSERRAS